MEARSGAHLLVESLLAEGVHLLFGIPGVGTLAVYDAFVDHPRLRHIEVRHEQSAVFMADGYARGSGRVGVAFTSNGPGALNTITAMATAHNDSVPVLHLVSENPPDVRRKGKGHFHDISDQFGIFRPVTGHAAQVAQADEIPAAINNAFFALRNRRPRPALVEFANEAFTTPSTARVLPSAPTLERPIDPIALARAAEVLAGAERPLVWAGGGIANPEAAAALIRVVERLGAPVITTQKGKGAVPAEHPLHIGNWANEQPTRDLIAECNVLLAVGTRFSYFPTGGWSLRLPDRVVQIDIDPAEIGRNYRVEAGVVGDAAVALAGLEPELDRLGHQPLPWRDDEVAKVLARVRVIRDLRERNELTTIDIHAHAIVPAALAKMASRHPDHGPTLIEDEGRRYLRYPGRERLGPLPEAIFEPPIRLADMDRQRVDLQVIAIPPPNFHYHVPPEVGADFAVIQNDALIALSDKEPDRFHLFATLPLQDVDASLAEIDRVAVFPRVRGVQLGSNINGTDMDDPTLEPVWAELERRSLPVWFHSDQRAIAGAERLDSYYLQNLIGIPMESTIAAAKLIFGGVLERHPDLRVGFTHGGGFAPYQVGRWDHGWSIRPEPKVNITGDGPRHYFGTLYFDSLTHDAISLEMLGKRMGWGHVMLGSDYPFDMASTDPVAGVEAVEMSDTDRAMVLGGNAELFLRPLDRVV